MVNKYRCINHGFCFFFVLHHVIFMLLNIYFKIKNTYKGMLILPYVLLEDYKHYDRVKLERNM